jgi:hypothetical protein
MLYLNIACWQGCNNFYNLTNKTFVREWLKCFDECDNIFPGKEQVAIFNKEEIICGNSKKMSSSGIEYLPCKYLYEIKSEEGVKWMEDNCENISPCRIDYSNQVICDNPIKTYRCGDYFVERNQ